MLAFGAYDPHQPNDLDMQSQMSYRCREITAARTRSPATGRLGNRRPKVEISLSTGLAGTYDRSMSRGTEQLFYNIYLDASRRDIWGDGSRGTSVFKNRDASVEAPETIPIFGRIFAGQNVAGGSYFDVIVITIDF